MDALAPSASCGVSAAEPAAKQRRPDFQKDLDGYLAEKGLYVDWGAVNDTASWWKSLLHNRAQGAYGAVFKCDARPGAAPVAAHRLVVKVSTNESDQQLTRRTSFMSENAAFNCVPHVAIVRSRARFAKCSSLAALKLGIESRPDFAQLLQDKDFPAWLRPQLAAEYLVMDLCEGGDLERLLPDPQPWYNPFHPSEQNRIVLSEGVDSRGNKFVRIAQLPADTGCMTDDRRHMVAGFVQSDVLLSVTWHEAKDGQTNEKRMQVTTRQKAESILHRVHFSDIPAAVVEVCRVRPGSSANNVKIPIGYSRCTLRPGLVAAVQKQLVHALWLLQTYRTHP